MSIEDKANERKPYVLTKEELTMPGGAKEEQRLWFDSLVRQQVEGIDNGVRPQNPVLSEGFHGAWRREVWNVYRRTLRSRDRRAIPRFSEGRISSTSGPGQAMHNEIENIRGDLGGGTPGNAFKIPKVSH